MKSWARKKTQKHHPKKQQRQGTKEKSKRKNITNEQVTPHPRTIPFYIFSPKDERINLGIQNFYTKNAKVDGTSSIFI